MSLREEMWKYEQITGESAEHVPIIKLGAFLDGYEMGVKALEQTRWIPVSERLPEEDGLYLVTDAFGAYPPYVLKREKASLLNCVKWATIVAWMPLPKPYEEGEEEE